MLKEFIFVICAKMMLLTQWMVLIWLIKEVFYNFFYYKFFLSCIKMSENTYLTYYQRNKERLKKQARDKYRNVCEEEKNKKREYREDRYHNMSEEKKQKLKEYQKNYREAKKSQYRKNKTVFLIVITAVILTVF